MRSPTNVRHAASANSHVLKALLHMDGRNMRSMLIYAILAEVASMLALLMQLKKIGNSI